MSRGWIGRRVLRKEDHRFLTGHGRFTDDLADIGAVWATMVRSPHPHARIVEVDASQARTMDGVLTVLTGRDVEGKIAPVPSLARTAPFARLNRDGSPMPDPCQPALATTKVRYAGEPVAVVVAETEATARDAAEAVAVEYEPLPAVIAYEQARAPDTPVWDEIPGNVTFDREQGDREATDAAFAAAAHVVELTVANNRVTPVFLEPRSAIASHDAGTGAWTLTLGCQTAHGMRGILAGMLGIAPERLRVIVPDMGGGFGARGTPYPEFALILAAAQRTGRTVRWTATRAESFLTDAQSRDHLLHGALAMDAEGRFTAMRALVEWRHGAYVTPRGFATMTDYLIPTIGGPYRIPAGYIEMRGYSSNTTPVAAYRGIGRVESSYLAESLVDAAAAATGIDRIELRRRNLVAPREMPWTAPGGCVYHGGDFRANLDRAADAIDMAGFGARSAESARRGRLRGIAATPYVENDGGAPADYAKVEAHPDGTVTVFAGTQNFGMGHETVYAQIAADRLGIDFDAVRFVDGDTARVKEGFGSHGFPFHANRGNRVRDGRGRHDRAWARARRRDAGGGERRRRVRRRRIQRRRHQPLRHPCRGRGIRGGARRGAERRAALHHRARLPRQRRRRLRGGDRPGDRGGRHRPLRHRLRHRPDHQSDARRGAAPRRRRPGPRPGGAGADRLRPGDGQTLTGSLMDYAIPRADDLPALEVVLTEVAETTTPSE